MSAVRSIRVQIEINRSTKEITFKPWDEVDPHFFCTQTESKKCNDERDAHSRVDDQLAGVSASWFESVNHDGVHLQFDDSIIRASGAIEIAESWLTERCLPELPNATSLGGCTVEDVRRVLACLYVHSLYVTKLEDVADDQSVSLPSHVFSCSRPIPLIGSRPCPGSARVRSVLLSTL